MKPIKIIIALIILLFCLDFSSVKANQAACNPTEVKPQALGSTVISPDIIAVGNDAIVRMTSDGASRITIGVPKEYFEIVDYSPKIIDGGTAKAGEWEGKLPAGDYDVILKAKKFTAGKWVSINTTAAVWGGTSYGYQNFFIFYDTLSISISLSDRNEVPQTTMDVVRKVTVSAVPNVQVSLQADKGMLGKNIADKTSQNLSLTANDKGEATAYLFAQEKDKVNLTASSTDSCQDLTMSQKFSVLRSNVGRNVAEDNYWLWYVIGLIILSGLIFLIFFFWYKRKEAKQQQSPSINSQTPEETSEMNASSNNLQPPSIPEQSKTLESLSDKNKE